jgi:hypothetical protein
MIRYWYRLENLDSNFTLLKDVNSRPKSVFKEQEAVKCLSSLHDKYVIVPVDKASSNIVLRLFTTGDV